MKTLKQIYNDIDKPMVAMFLAMGLIFWGCLALIVYVFMPFVFDWLPY